MREPPTVQSISIGKALLSIEAGLFAVPRLQREFVWNGAKAAKLLDSIYRNLPIGSIVVWKAPRSARDLLRNTLHILPPYDSSHSEVQFLIDGQQRLSVLYQAFKGELRKNARRQDVDFGRLVFSVEPSPDGESPFRYRHPVPGQHVPLSKILAPNWRRLLRKMSKTKLKRAERCRTAILGYKIPFIFVESTNLEEIRELFIRINSLGTPIGAADRAFARASTVDLRAMTRDVMATLPPEFQGVSDEMLLQTVALIEGVKEVGERAFDPVLRRLEKRSAHSKRDKARFLAEWNRLRNAIGKAVDMLRADFRVLDEGFLPSGYMVSMLTLFFFHHPAAPSKRQREEIRKWFWATGVSQRYSGRGFRTNILEDAEFFRRLASLGTARFVLKERVDRSELRRADYARKGSLSDAFFCLLASNDPSYVENGEPLPLHIYASRANRKNKHHIFPRSYLSRRNVPAKWINSICNICFIVAEENQGIGGSRPPSAYLEAHRRRRHFRRAMRSHFIPVDGESGLWDRNVSRGFRSFLKARELVISNAFEKAAGTRLFRRT